MSTKLNRNRGKYPVKIPVVSRSLADLYLKSEIRKYSVELLSFIPIIPYGRVEDGRVILGDSRSLDALQRHIQLPIEIC